MKLKKLTLLRLNDYKKRSMRLFTKNTGLCKAVRQSIGSEACPVPDNQTLVIYD
eukprot:TRINITY_DN6552_c0_g1_i1.p2 TRINITY_DN6552_c0_g1~~TRINITY_DN6552_c0_g1_i1.p2  ORF type:complete len:54 (-),score=1.92 TRINITY_DN6552_c0_g1_i1:844-1005(-)